MSVTVTKEMEAAGYAAIKKLADMHGEGWALRMVSTSDVYTAMEYVYKAMRALEPTPVADTPPAAPAPSSGS